LTLQPALETYVTVGRHHDRSNGGDRDAPDELPAGSLLACADLL
jgi:hypothetical protein